VTKLFEDLRSLQIGVIVLSVVVILLCAILWESSIPHDPPVPPRDPFQARLCNMNENGDYVLIDNRWQCINNGFFG
jgi:hypothetical protein